MLFQYFAATLLRLLEDAFQFGLADLRRQSVVVVLLFRNLRGLRLNILFKSKVIDERPVLLLKQTVGNTRSPFLELGNFRRKSQLELPISLLVELQRLLPKWA